MTREQRGWWILIGAGVVYTAIVAIIVAVRAESTTDFRDFWENAVHFRETGQIAADLGVHNYLPFFTIFMLPWGLLPLRAAIVVFVVLSLVLFAITVALAERLLNERARPGPRPALLLALVLVIPYVHSCAVLGNVGLLILFLIVTAWFLVEHNRPWEAGLALGLAALIKLLPVVLLVFFLLKHRWRVAGAALATMVVLGLGLPAATVGLKQTVTLHQDFYTRAVRGGSAIQTVTSDQPAKAMYSNNAIPMVLRRLFSPLDSARGGARPLYVDMVDLSRPTILAIYVLLMLTFVATTVALTVPYSHPWPPEGAAGARAVRAQFALWCCLMLLVSPLVWTHYLPLAYWPLALLANRVERTGRTGQTCRVSAAALAIWFVAALLLAWPPARAAGAQIAAVAVVWLALVMLSLRARAG